MSPKDVFEPDFWSITGSNPVISAIPVQPPRARQPLRNMRPQQTTMMGLPVKPVRKPHATLMGLPERRLSIYRMVAGMEAELMRSPSLIQS